MQWAALLLALVAGATAQVMPCSGPESFTGRFRRMDRERKYFVEGKMFYDSVNKRIREFEFEDIDSSKVVYDKLKLYNVNIEYTVDLKTRKCNVTAPRHPWTPFGVPPEARYKGSGTMGAVGIPNEEVTVAFFEGGNETAPFFVTATLPDCFLVEFGFYSEERGYYHGQFYDVVSGIVDPDAFDVPSACTQP